MKNRFEAILNRKENGSMKWERAYIKKRFGIAYQEDIYPLFIADMDYCMEEDIVLKLQEKLREPDFGYFHIQQGYYDSIVEWQKRVRRVNIKAEHIVASLGTVASINIACDIYARTKAIAILTPVYGPFAKCADIGTCIQIPLAFRNGRYELDLPAIEKAFIQKKVKVLLFCNPHNPSGRVWERSELSAVMELCRTYDVLLISDEIHSDLNLGIRPFTSFIDVCEEDDKVIISTSPNKTFNLSGLTTSYILCKNKRIREDFQRYMDRLHLSCNRMGIIMSELVYTYGYDWLQKLILQIKRNIKIVEDTMQELPVFVMQPESGYLVWIYLPQIKDVDAFVLELAENTRVLVEAGSRFVNNYQGWIRINVATSEDLLKEAMKRFARYYRAVSKL